MYYRMAGVIQSVPQRIYAIRSRDSLLPGPKLICGFSIYWVNTKAPWNTKEALLTMFSPRTFPQRAYNLSHEWVSIHRDKGYVHGSGTADPRFWVDSFIWEWEVLSSLPAKKEYTGPLSEWNPGLHSAQSVDWVPSGTETLVPDCIIKIYADGSWPCIRSLACN